jgi:hypothetical protein
MELKTYSILGDIESKKLRLNKLTQEIKDSETIEKFSGLTMHRDSESFTIHGASVLVEEKLIDTVKSHEPESFEEKREEKMKVIDERTGSLIRLGYTYEEQDFSASSNAQINLIAMEISKDTLVYPIRINTIDDKSSFIILGSEKMHEMYLKSIQTKDEYLDSGRELKEKVNEAETKEELELIVDDRKKKLD